MRLWIKYDSVSFKAAETCQNCHLFSDSIAVKWQFKSGGLSLSWQVFNLCSISAHCRALFCIHCFCRPSFISRALLFSHSLAVSHSLPLSPSYIVTSSLFFPTLLQFHLVLYSNSNSNTRLKAHKQLTHPTLTAPPTSNHLPHTNRPALNALILPLPASYCSFIPLLFLPFPPSSC